MKKYRVIILGTGNVSSYAVKALNKRDNMEIVGVWTTDFAKDDIGKDAGLLRHCDGQPIGVTVTGDLDALIALKPDVAMMGLGGPNVEATAVPIACKLLRAGIDVVGTTLLRYLWPETCLFKDDVAAIEAACKEGNATFFVSGNHPGFACDYLPVAMMTSANKIESINAVEIMNYSIAPNEFEMKEGRGFGMPVEFKALSENPEFIKMTWGPCVDYIASALGYKCEDYTTSYEKAVTDHDVPVAYGTIPAGTVAAVRLTVTGIINGKPAITVGAVNRMSEDCAPDWQSGSKPGVYYITVKGEPSMSMEYSYDMSVAYGYSIVACRALNAIPAVCAAKAGMISSYDLPFTVPTHAFD